MFSALDSLIAPRVTPSGFESLAGHWPEKPVLLLDAGHSQGD
jgi:hypothetical protein